MLSLPKVRSTKHGLSLRQLESVGSWLEAAAGISRQLESVVLNYTGLKTI